MKRLAYRTVLAWLMAANAMLLAYQAPSGHPLSRVLGAVGLGYVSIMVVAYATGVAHHLGRGDACRFVHRRQRPDARRTIPGAAAAEQRVRDYVQDQLHAAAVAAVAADHAQQTPGDTAVMPVVQTGLTWGFGPTTSVVDALPEPWTPLTDTLAGRHAGMPAELQEFDYEPAGVAR